MKCPHPQIYIYLLFIPVTWSSILRYQEEDRFFFFPGDGDGLIHLVDTHAPIDDNFITEYARNPNSNRYWLFTRHNPLNAQILLYKDVDSFFISNFDIRKTTVLLVHGWLGSGDNEMNKLLTEAFLEDDDVNIIVLDWSDLANRNYITAKRGIKASGSGLGRFIKWLASLGVSYEKLHLVGFSLGAHMVGHAGRYIGSRVKRITGLDPAGPLWKRDENRLNKTDAQYVEVIHTNTDMYGYTDPCGQADFYPNGGSSMPGCWFNVCSHSKAYEYLAASIKHNNFHANECNSYKDVTRNKCDGELYPMGNSDLNKSRSGIFRVSTER